MRAILYTRHTIRDFECIQLNIPLQEDWCKCHFIHWRLIRSVIFPVKTISQQRQTSIEIKKGLKNNWSDWNLRWSGENLEEVPITFPPLCFPDYLEWAYPRLPPMTRKHQREEAEVIKQLFQESSFNSRAACWMIVVTANKWWGSQGGHINGFKHTILRWSQSKSKKQTQKQLISVVSNQCYHAKS